MRKQIVAALLAAASLMPGIAMAQDMDRQANREARMAQREARQQQRAERAPAAAVQRPQREARPQVAREPHDQMQRPMRPQIQRVDRAGGMQTRDLARDWQSARPAAVRQNQPAAVRQERREDRREDRRDFAAERNRDRQALQAGTVTRDQFRRDRQQDQRAFQRDRAQDQRAAQRDRVQDPGAYRQNLNPGGWNDQRRWSGNFANRNDRWDDRNRFATRGGWNRGWRGDNRYDWNGFRAQNRNAFRLPRYYAPYGWNAGYRRFSIGAQLSSVLFQQNYWIDDPWAYHLPEADGPFRWVRYYNDALLVDLDSGEVVDVIEGIFW